MMIHPKVARHIPEIRRLCREYGVARLEIFGSAVTGAFNPDQSDVDSIVTYPKDYDFGLWLIRFFDFEHALVRAAGRDVHLIMNGAPRNPHFIDEINRTRVAIYDATEHAHVA